MEITLTAGANIRSDIYYYIVFETANPLSADGPRPILSGAERGKNWSYYIRLYNGVFTEKVISNINSIDEEPDLFNSNSPRFYQAAYSNNTIYVNVFIDQFASATEPLSFNFITSLQPVTATQEAIPAIDYLGQPRISFTPYTGNNARESNYPQTSSHYVADPDYLAADITHWYLNVYEK